MYEGSHVPLEIMSDFYGKVTPTALSFLPSAAYGETRQTRLSGAISPAELTRPHHEAVHGHLLPARDDPPVLRQRLLHEAQHRLRAGASVQRREGQSATRPASDGFSELGSGVRPVLADACIDEAISVPAVTRRRVLRELKLRRKRSIWLRATEKQQAMQRERKILFSLSTHAWKVVGRTFSHI